MSTKPSLWAMERAEAVWDAWVAHGLPTRMIERFAAALDDAERYGYKRAFGVKPNVKQDG